MHSASFSSHRQLIQYLSLLTDLSLVAFGEFFAACGQQRRTGHCKRTLDASGLCSLFVPLLERTVARPIVIGLVIAFTDPRCHCMPDRKTLCYGCAACVRHCLLCSRKVTQMGMQSLPVRNVKSTNDAMLGIGTGSGNAWHSPHTSRWHLHLLAERGSR